NLYYLGEAGSQRLLELAREGALRMRFPEQGALLALAWLREEGYDEEAATLLEEISPLLSRLRFFPDEGEPRRAGSESVRVLNVLGLKEKLQRRAPNDAVETMREVLAVWRPMTESFVAHALRVDEGPEADWFDALVPILDGYDRAVNRWRRAVRPHRRKENLGALVACFREARGSRSLSEAARRRILAVAKRWSARHGAPGSTRRAARRAAELQSIAAPSHAHLAHAVANQLKGQDPERGLTDPEALAQQALGDPAAEGARELPVSVSRLLDGAREASLEELIERGAVRSLETVAKLLPQLVAPIHALRHIDPVCATLVREAYEAFSRRRSLLLLNLSRQVRLEDLPWMAAVYARARVSEDSVEVERALMRRVQAIMTRSFPGTVMPNPLTRELATVTRTMDGEWPWVEEIAADIFMGTWTDKFVAACRRAGARMRGTLYERYYGLGYSDLEAIQRPADLTVLTGRRIEPWLRSRGGVAEFGMHVEFVLLLATQNMALLEEAAGSSFGGESASAAEAALLSSIRTTQTENPDFRTRARARRRSAYAWRQGVYHLSHASEEETTQVLRRIREELRDRSERLGALRREELMAQLDVLEQARSAEREPAWPAPLLGWGDPGPSA
ncbi:MAG: hypothetical protein AAGG01_03920, partial [Planctomycetota bacterium]